MQQSHSLFAITNSSYFYSSASPNEAAVPPPDLTCEDSILNFEYPVNSMISDEKYEPVAGGVEIKQVSADGNAISRSSLVNIDFLYVHYDDY